MIVVRLAMILCYYHLGGLATTNIIRLTKGNTMPVGYSKCKCPNCDSEIKPFWQLPIISFLLCKGKCRVCGTQIPIQGLLLEITVMTGMSVITAISSFSSPGVMRSFLFYEAVRIACIVKYGKRESGFKKEYVKAILYMIPFFVMIEILALIVLTDYV